MKNINWKKDAVAATGKCLIKAIYIEYKKHRPNFTRDDAVGVYMTHFSWMKTYLERTQKIKIPNWYNAVKQRISRGTEPKYHDEWPEINQYTKAYWPTALSLAKRTYFQRTVNEAYVSSAARGAAMDAGLNPDTNKPLDVEPEILTKKKPVTPTKKEDPEQEPEYPITETNLSLDHLRNLVRALNMVLGFHPDIQIVLDGRTVKLVIE